MNTRKIGIVILAAGESARFGGPKQLLKIEGKSFLRRAAHTAVSQDGCKVVVVIGEEIQSLRNEISSLPIEIVVNHDWKIGISSSIKLGLQTLLDDETEMDAVIFMLCDQPFVNSDTIAGLTKAYRTTQKPIIAARYEDTLGVPALFDRALFAEIMDLRGDVGAKPIIRRHAANVYGVDAPEAFLDIDDADDYEKHVTQKQK